MSTPTHNFKPCPFCGNSDRAWMLVLIDEEGEKSVRCCKCNASGPTRKFKTLAVRAWNSWEQPKEATP